MARGLSIHIGLNLIDVDVYGPGNELAGCVNDARDLQNLAVAQGFQTTLMLDEGATSEAVIAAISGAANTLRSGDILLLTYSGHGSQVPDKNGDEPDGKDETWCLYDRMLLDDELYSLWAQFEEGVRIVMLSDSCHSGTVARMLQTQELMGSPAFKGQFRNLYQRADGGAAPPSIARASRTPPPSSSKIGAAPPMSAGTAATYATQNTPVSERTSKIRFRFLEPAAAERAYAKSKTLYDSVQRVVGRNVKETVSASVILISGCQDDQLSADGEGNGLFTEKLKDTWQNGAFTGDYPAFHKAIAAKMPVSQTPNYFAVGAVDPAFEKQKPFTVTTDATNQPVSSALWVSGPASMSRSDPAPRFQVNPGPNNYFIFEITSDASLFDTGNASSRRTDQNFYGSWQDSAHFWGTEYTLPEAKWDLLKSSDTLYYRIGSTAMSDGWSNYMVSTPDQQYDSAPSIQLSGVSVGAGEAPGTGMDVTETGIPSIMGPEFISATDPAPSFDVDTAGAPYFIVEVATEAWLLDGNVADSERREDKFYATWQDSELQTGGTYDLPEEIWERLQVEGALYYRVGTTTSETGWGNYKVSTEDADVEGAPYIQITGRDLHRSPEAGESRAVV
jgi:hypothetical protein